jgi:hypothetical protein
MYLLAQPSECDRGIGGRWRPGILCEVARRIDDDLGAQGAVEVAAHAIGHDRQQALLVGGLENAPAVLLFVPSAQFAGGSLIPSVGVARFPVSHLDFSIDLVEQETAGGWPANRINGG